MIEFGFISGGPSYHVYCMFEDSNPKAPGQPTQSDFDAICDGHFISAGGSDHGVRLICDDVANSDRQWVLYTNCDVLRMHVITNIMQRSTIDLGAPGPTGRR